MRIITSYACTLDADTAEEASWRFELYRGVLDDWLRDQGVSDPRANTPSDTFIQLERRDVSHNEAEIDGFLLKEPVLESSHMLHTRLDLARSESALALFLQFGVERKTNRIAPANVHVECPRPLATILETGHWRHGQDRLRAHHRRAFGIDAGRRLAMAIADPARTTPIVLLANLGKPDWTSVPQREPYSEQLWRGFVTGLESDIGGLSQIIEVDALASEAMDPNMDGVLVRLLWPLGGGDFWNDQHPAWAPFDYYFELDDRDDPLEYDIHYGGTGNPNPSWITVFRRHELMSLLPRIRDIVFQQAAWQPVPVLIDEIRQAFEIAEREKHAEHGDWDEIAESYRRDAERERDRASREAERAEELERENDSLNRRLKERHSFRQREMIRAKASESILPITTAHSPESVIDALRLAAEGCSHLLWGKNVWESSNKVESEPALAAKVLSALKALDEGTRAASEGRLGNTLAGWIHDNHGIESSPDADEKKFLDHNGRSYGFSLHLKLKEATAANKAVRIYFEHRPKEEKTLVGYLGPHL